MGNLDAVMAWDSEYPVDAETNDNTSSTNAHLVHNIADNPAFDFG